MTARMFLTSEAPRFVHHHLLKLIVLSYLLAALYPAPGLRIKEAAIVDIQTASGRATATTPKLLLALLLFNAGMRVRAGRVAQIARRPCMMFAGLAANLAVPLIFLAVMVPTMRLWHNPDEASIVLIGLALVTAMPIAGSSAGWAQAADGDMALSLSLVLSSTLLSPLTTPGSLYILGAITPGACGQDLRHLAGLGTGTFLAAWVLSPSVLGVATRMLLGEQRAAAVESRLRLVAPLSLLLLCYINASACLPGTLREPDWDFLGIILAFVAGLCVSTFAAGYVVAKLLGADRSQRAALMFGLGMNNNGTGLVLASSALGAQPLAMLPIIFYNLTQHLVAGGVDAMLRRRTPA